MIYKNFAVCCGHDIDYYCDITKEQCYINRKGQYVIKDKYIDKINYITLQQDLLLNTNDSEPDFVLFNDNGLKIFQYNSTPVFNPYIFNNYKWVIVSSKYANSCIYNNWDPYYLNKLLIPEILYKKIEHKNKTFYKPIGAVGFKKAFSLKQHNCCVTQNY